MYPLNNDPSISSSLLNLFTNETSSYEPHNRYETQHGIHILPSYV